MAEKEEEKYDVLEKIGMFYFTFQFFAAFHMHNCILLRLEQ